MCGGNRETCVVPLEEGVGGVDVLDMRHPQGLDQAVLKGLEQPLHPPLGLWGESPEGGDVEALQCALELGGLGVFRVVFGEDGVAARYRRPPGAHGGAHRRRAR
jgi:hypothetical protein